MAYPLKGDIMQKSDNHLSVPFQYVRKNFFVTARDVMLGHESGVVNLAFVNDYLSARSVADSSGDEVEGIDPTDTVGGDSESCVSLLKSLVIQEVPRNAAVSYSLWLCIILSYVIVYYDELDTPAQLLDYTLDRIQPLDRPLELRLALIALRGNLPTYNRLAIEKLTSSDLALKSLLSRTKLESCAEHQYPSIRR